jgi:membrane protease YdiL (CAAX protease family)
MAATPPIAPIPWVPLLLRLLLPLAGAVLAAWALDWSCRRKGLQPPGFRRPWRRGAGSILVVAILWIAIFRPLGEVGLELKLDLSHVSTAQLFLLHALMAIAVLGWFALGFAGLPPPGRPAAVLEADWPPPEAAPSLETAPETAPPDILAISSAAALPPPPRPPGAGRQLAAQLGLVAASIPREVSIGLLAGILAWGAVLAALLAVAFVVWAVGGDSALPKPSAIVPWIAALPLLVRFLVSLSAGVVEETFFRGFLQPRIGIVASTAFFVLAHVSYGQPLMLVGITLLSLIFAFLVRWRQTIWPAIAAHALFDGIQLLVVIPLALRMLGQSAAAKAAVAAAWLVLRQATRSAAGL